MVDKDLLCRGNKEYAPDKCCILPQTINSALASATKKEMQTIVQIKWPLE